MVALAAAACGLSSVGRRDAEDAEAERAAPAAAVPSAPEGSASNASRSDEPRITEVACGTTTCSADRQVCCVLDGLSACVDRDAGGCSVADAADADADAATAPPPLACVSYRSCKADEECCYSREAGSSCAKRCEPGMRRLCRPLMDRCDDDRHCVLLLGAPLPGMGECVSDD